MSSRKRKKNKGTAKKPRIQRIDSFFKLSEEGNYKVILNPDSGLELQNEAGETIAMSKVNSRLYYDRETKPKIVAYSDSSMPPFQNASLSLRNYKYLCAIDTNTRKVHGRMVSVSIICLGRWVIEGEHTKFSFWPELYMDFLDFTGKAERFAWGEFLKLIEKGADYDGINNFGVIVDSELGEIPSINKRQTPLYEEYYLPRQMELIYASSDKSGTVQNIMIKKCDQFASERLNEIEEMYASPEAINKLPDGYTNIDRILFEPSA